MSEGNKNICGTMIFFHLNLRNQNFLGQRQNNPSILLTIHRILLNAFKKSISCIELIFMSWRIFVLWILVIFRLTYFQGLRKLFKIQIKNITYDYRCLMMHCNEFEGMRKSENKITFCSTGNCINQIIYNEHDCSIRHAEKMKHVPFI